MNLIGSSTTPKLERPCFSLGLIGYPLGHSLSPQIHQAALKALNLEGVYNLYPVAPSSQVFDELDILLDMVRSGKIQGLNVTIPHKQNVIRLVDELTPEAEAIGAVNTIYRKEGRLFGDNTDSCGFLSDLSVQFKPRKFQAVQAVILGAGGSARSVAYALLQKNCHLMIAARRVSQAEEVRKQYAEYNHRIIVRDLGGSLSGLEDCSLVVNATPVGMVPNVERSPWRGDIPFPPQAAVYDLVYNPPETLLVKQARAAGLQAVTGAGMLVEQAALAFERWTGLIAPRQVMLESLK